MQRSRPGRSSLGGNNASLVAPSLSWRGTPADLNWTSDREGEAMTLVSRDVAASEQGGTPPPQETEIRRLLTRRRRKERLPDVRSASHLDLNREFSERSDETAKYFFGALILFGLLSAICEWTGIR